MRTVTYNAGAYLVEELWRAGVVRRFLHDGGDIILFETRTGERVSIHLIESSIELYEIRHILRANDADGIYTLFILWGDRMLPYDGATHTAADWMQAFYTLYNGHIFAYDIYGSEIFVFPVYFEGGEARRSIRFGTTVHMAHLECAASWLDGEAWRVARFAERQRQAADAAAAPVAHPLAAAFAILGVDEDDDREAVRKAYRLLARRYHPDLNRAPDATRRMQQVNDAYARVMTAFDADHNPPP